MLLLSQNQKNGDVKYVQTFLPSAQQDTYGAVANVSWGVQSRTQESWGALQASAQFQFGQGYGIEASQGKSPIGTPGGGFTFKNSNTLFAANMSYSWGPLGNVAVGRFSSEYQYFAKGDFGINPYGVGNSRTWHGYYQWNSSGTNQDSVGWTINLSLEENPSHGDGGQWSGVNSKGLDGNPCAVGTAAGCNGFGGVAITRGPNRFFDFFPNVRWLDDDIGSVFAAFAVHQIDKQAVAGASGSLFGLGAACSGPGISVGITLGGCSTGQVVHGMGYGGLFAVLLNMPKTPGNAPFARDLMVAEFTKSDGAMDAGGFKPSNRVRGGSPPFTEGGLMMDDGDAIAIALPGGGFKLEKEKYQVLDYEYKHYITSCTDPDWCWNMHAAASFGWIRPGTIAQNTDWTKGGVGNYFGQAYELGIHWGVAELTWEVEADVMWAQHKQDLAHDPGVAPTPIPYGLAKDSGSWAFALSFARNFGGSVGKNLAGF
jgi:hypothetical protein